MRFNATRVIAAFVAAATATAWSSAQMPDRPLITEVYTDPPGANDGPVGRDMSNAHQEFLEIYIPRLQDLDPNLDKDALRLTLYEVEGDFTSSGTGLVNYRFDLPTFDLDPGNGMTEGAIRRPPNGVVVLGWVDYTGDPPVDLRGSPDSRVALINGGVTETTDFTFIAINGHHFNGTQNFPTLTAESFIDVPSETRSGIIQNGSGVYLLVDRDSPGYVELFDDKHIPNGESADPDLSGGGVLKTSAVLDAFAANDHDKFDVTEQPYDPPTGDDIDLETVLPLGGPFSRLVCQLPELGGRPLLGFANGYARRFVDVAKTTDNDNPDDDDPVADALDAYRHVRNDGPFYPTPGRAALTNSAPELGVAAAIEQRFELLTQTTGRPGLLTANAGGNFGIKISVSGGTSSDPNVAVFTPGDATAAVSGQTLGFPSVAITVGANATHGQSANAEVTVEALNVSEQDPKVMNPIQLIEVKATVLSPTRGRDENNQPFQTTIFLAVQGIPAGAERNELLTTDLGKFLKANLGKGAFDAQGNGPLLLNPDTDISDPAIVTPIVEEFPQDSAEFINRPGAPNKLDLVQTVLQSAEVRKGLNTYDDSINQDRTGVKAITFDTPGTLTFGGTFSPTERLHFADPRGFVAEPRSGLSNATTRRTFEVVLLDTNVKPTGEIETGATDDFGIIIRVGDVEDGSPVTDQEFVFLSFTGGLQGADIDTLQVPPGRDVIANLIYLDLDNLHDVLKIKTIKDIYLIDGSGSGDVEIIEVFNLNPLGGGGGGGEPGDLNCDGSVDLVDVSPFITALLDPQRYDNEYPDCDINNADINEDGSVDLVDVGPFIEILIGP